MASCIEKWQSTCCRNQTRSKFSLIRPDWFCHARSCQICLWGSTWWAWWWRGWSYPHWKTENKVESNLVDFGGLGWGTEIIGCVCLGVFRTLPETSTGLLVHWPGGKSTGGASKSWFPVTWVLTLTGDLFLAFRTKDGWTDSARWLIISTFWGLGAGALRGPRLRSVGTVNCCWWGSTTTAALSLCKICKDGRGHGSGTGAAAFWMACMAEAAPFPPQEPKIVSHDLSLKSMDITENYHGSWWHWKNEDKPWGSCIGIPWKVHRNSSLRSSWIYRFQ